jgi:hypothetical protein
LIPYILLLLIVTLVLLAEKVIPSKIRIYFSVLILVLFCGLRASSVGVDTNNYVGWFLNVDMSQSFLYNPYSTEYGYTLLIKTISLLSDEYWSFLLISGALAIILNVRALYVLSHNFRISIFLFLTTCTYFFVFNGLRQGIAAAFFSLAIVCIVKDEKFKYLGWVLVAALFHQSVLITLPFFLIARQKFSFKFIAQLVVTSVAFIALINNLDFFLESSESQRYTQYVDRGATGAGLLTIFFTALPCLYIFFRKFIKFKYLVEYDIYLNFSVVVSTIYMAVFFMGLDVNFVRLAIYFSFGHLLIWPIIFKSEFNGFKKIIFLVFISVFCMFYFVYLIKMGYLPYIFNSNIF